MSQDNVEIVRRSFEALERSMRVHFSDPRSVVDAMNAADLPLEFEELFSRLDPDVEWNTAFAGLSFRGHRGCAAGWDWLFEVADDFRLTLMEVVDLDGGRVLVALDRVLKGKGSEIEVSAPMFSVVTLRNGLIVRMDEYSTRAEADAAASASPPPQPAA
jgi:ketosteroid isomerase-like protein